MLFIRIVALCDDGANYYGDAKLLLAQVFAQRWANGTATLSRVKKWLKPLVDEGLVVLYPSNGRTYLHVVKCKKHLRKDIPRDVRFPMMPRDVYDNVYDDVNDDVYWTDPVTYPPYSASDSASDTDTPPNAGVSETELPKRNDDEDPQHPGYTMDGRPM